MIKVPGERPFVPHITPKEAKGEEKIEEKPAAPRPAPKGESIGKGPEMDTRAIQVRMAAMATEAKAKEISAEEFEEILEEAIKLTGLKEPQAALEEADRRRQKEIDIELERIKSNKDLMEEAEDWQRFAELLSSMNEEQVTSFLGLLHETIKGL